MRPRYQINLHLSLKAWEINTASMKYSVLHSVNMYPDNVNLKTIPISHRNHTVWKKLW